MYYIAITFLLAALNPAEITTQATPAKDQSRIPPVVVRRQSEAETFGNHTIIYKLREEKR